MLKPWTILAALLAVGCAEDPAADGDGADQGGLDEDAATLDQGPPSDACGPAPGRCEPTPCPTEGLWAVGDGVETALLVRLEPEGSARVVSHRVPVDTCSQSAGRPGTGSATARFDAASCRINLSSEASWCFSGEQQCREVAGTLDLRTGGFEGTFDVQACAFPGPGPRTAAVSRLEACPFTSRLDENPGPGVTLEPAPATGEAATYGGQAEVAEVADTEDGRQRLVLATPGDAVRLFLSVPAPLRLAVGDAVWVAGAASSNGFGGSAVVLKRGEGAPDDSDPVIYAAVSRSIPPGAALAVAAAGLDLASVPTCPLSTYCAPEGTGLALAVRGEAQAAGEPMAVPGEGFWHPADPELWVQVHGGLEGQPTQCNHTSGRVVDYEAVRWPAPVF